MSSIIRLAALLPWLLGATLDRATFVADVLEANPEVDAARAAVDVALAGVRTVTPPQPTVSYMVAPLSLGGGVPGHEVRVSQGLPFSGRLASERAAFRARGDAASADLDGVRIELAMAASALYDDWWLVGRALALNEAHRELVVELGEGAHAAYATSRAPQSAPLQAELAGLHLELDRIALLAEKEVVRTQMSALLHRDDAELGDAVSDAPTLDLPAIEVEGRPDVRRFAALGEAAGREATAAHRMRIPEIELMGAYSTMEMHDEHRFTAGVGLEVPLWAGREGAVADAMAAEAEAMREHVTTEGEAEALTARTRAVSAHDRWKLVEERLVPVARQRLDAATVAFQAGAAEFDEVIEASRDLLDAELDGLEATVDFHREKAALEAAIGVVPGGAR